MSHVGHLQAYVSTHRQNRWLYFAVAFLGVWLVSSAVLMGTGSAVPDGVREVTASRHLLPIETRATLVRVNDLVVGLLTIALALVSLSPRRVWAPWAVAILGIWLLAAPLVLWAPTPAAYANDSLIGIALIAMTVLAGGMPGMPLIMKMGREVPPGWSYNPSAWLQRMPIIALGWLGFFISRYLAAYQLGYIDSAWDPFFADGAQRILTSDVSRAWPVSDAGLGSMVYAGEALMGYMGGTDRWRTMPWMVAFFGILVVPLGMVSIGLVILQPVAVGTWCTLCLVTAVAMVIMIPLTLDEVVAMLEFWIRRVREGASWWRSFLLGYGGDVMSADHRTPDYGATLGRTVPASVWGVSLSWNLLVSVALGIWLMAAPYFVGAPGSSSADSSVLSGALVITIAMISLAEVTRAARFLNVPLGLWIAASGWLLGAPFPASVGGVAVGLLIVVLSLSRGPILEQYGGWQRYIR